MVEEVEVEVGLDGFVKATADEEEVTAVLAVEVWTVFGTVKPDFVGWEGDFALAASGMDSMTMEALVWSRLTTCLKERPLETTSGTLGPKTAASLRFETNSAGDRCWALGELEWLLWPSFWTICESLESLLPSPAMISTFWPEIRSTSPKSVLLAGNDKMGG